MLKTILIVTIMVSNLGKTENAYRDDLDYVVRDKGLVTDELAQNWDAEKIAGSSYVLMEPASGESVYLRFIESELAEGYQAMKSEGWNAVEILVADPDDLAVKLRKSPDFSVVGEPRYLTEQNNIKAMQAIGPAKELIYFTHISDPEKSGFGLLPGKSFVDRVFIMVVGSRDLGSLRDYYHTVFGLHVTEPVQYRIGVLSKAYGLADETKHDLAIASISNRFLIELDQYPQQVQARLHKSGHLPSGVAMVTFEVEDTDLLKTHFIGDSITIDEYPYSGRSSGVLRGTAGELIEVVQQCPLPSSLSCP